MMLGVRHHLPIGKLHDYNRPGKVSWITFKRVRLDYIVKIRFSGYFSSSKLLQSIASPPQHYLQVYGYPSFSYRSANMAYYIYVFFNVSDMAGSSYLSPLIVPQLQNTTHPSFTLRTKR